MSKFRNPPDCRPEPCSEPDVLRCCDSYWIHGGAVGGPEARFGLYNRFPRSEARYSVHTKLDWLAGDIKVPLPWSDLYGLARSLLALGPLLTLLFTRLSDLMFVFDIGPSGNRCVGSGLGLFCLGGHDHLQIKQWVAIVVLVGVVSGWRPRITCLPHAYVAVSLFHNLSSPDGGDQVASFVALMLVPVCLLDGRRWHWSLYNLPCVATRWGQIGVISAFLGMALIKIQVSGLYLHSAIAKLGRPTWVDGSGMYYWSRHGSYGAATWSRDTVYWLTSQPVFAAGMTWGPIAIEIAAGLSLLLHSNKLKRIILVAGISLHFFIGLLMGLWSFAVVMWGCLIFLLIPFGHLARTSPRGMQQHKVGEARAPGLAEATG
jgi:antimicrobial peptide system SdpB family protein